MPCSIRLSPNSVRMILILKIPLSLPKKKTKNLNFVHSKIYNLRFRTTLRHLINNARQTHSVEYVILLCISAKTIPIRNSIVLILNAQKGPPPTCINRYFKDLVTKSLHRLMLNSFQKLYMLMTSILICMISLFTSLHNIISWKLQISYLIVYSIIFINFF